MNGKTGDNPVSDMLIHGMHPFPVDIERMIRQLHGINPLLINDLEWDPFDWEQRKNLDQGRARLRTLLKKHGAEPDLE